MKQFLRLAFDHVIQSVNPKTLINSTLKLDGNKLVCNKKVFHLNNNCYIIGFGKAVYSMCEEVLTLLGNHIKQGVLSVPLSTISKVNPIFQKNNVKIYQGAENNLPDKSSVYATKEIMELVKPLKETDVLIILISGGGSALLTCPVPSVTLDEKVHLIKLLAFSGGDIKDLNCVRKQLSLVKGGKLAELIYPAQSLSLILSDVVGDPLSYIASGPTVPNTHTKKDALAILSKFKLVDKIPQNIFDYLTSKDLEKIPDYVFEKAFVKIIGSNEIALKAASDFLTRSGKSYFIMTSNVEGRVDIVSGALCLFTKYICQLMAHEINLGTFKLSVGKVIRVLSIDELNLNIFCEKYSSSIKELFFLFGGETTVNVTGKGKGGRNMELVLRFSQMLHKTIDNIEDFDIVLLSGGTDGMDGPTDAAGAVSYTGQQQEALRLGLNMSEFIKENNSYNFYKKFKHGEDLIITGLTGTNVMDIIMLYIKKK